LQLLIDFRLAPFGGPVYRAIDNLQSLKQSTINLQSISNLQS